MIVLDTNVVSELMRSAPRGRLVSWVTQQPAEELATTSVTLAEVRYGILRLPDGRRRVLLLDAFDDVFTAFRDKVLSFEAPAAAQYADIAAERERAGQPIGGFHGQIAAICRARQARSRRGTRTTSPVSASTSSTPGPSNPDAERRLVTATSRVSSPADAPKDGESSRPPCPGMCHFVDIPFLARSAGVPAGTDERQVPSHDDHREESCDQRATTW